MLHLTARNLVALKQPQQSRSSYIVCTNDDDGDDDDYDDKRFVIASEYLAGLMVMCGLNYKIQFLRRCL